MYYVYIDDEIANVYSSPIAAELYAEQLRRQGHEDVVVTSDN